MTKAHEEVSALTAFLNEQNAMSDYIDWAKSTARKRAETVERPTPTPDRTVIDTLTPEQRAANIRKYRARQAHPQVLGPLLLHLRDHRRASRRPLPRQPAGRLHGGRGSEPRRRSQSLRRRLSQRGRRLGLLPGRLLGRQLVERLRDPYYDVYGYPQMWNRGRIENAYQRATNTNPNLSMRTFAAARRR